MKSVFDKKLKALDLEPFRHEGVSQSVQLKHASIDRASRYFQAQGRHDQLQKLVQASRLWKWNAVLGLLGSVLLLGTMPQLLSIWLTKLRMAQQTMPEAAYKASLPRVRGPVVQKSLAEWGRRPAANREALVVPFPATLSGGYG